MYNLAVLDLVAGDTKIAAELFVRATKADEPAGYAALVELAEQADDSSTAARWAELGARAGNARCMGVHALYLADQGPANIDESIEWYERGAKLGDSDSMIGAGLGCAYRGNSAQARYWFEQAREAGHPDAQRLLETHCN